MDPPFVLWSSLYSVQNTSIKIWRTEKLSLILVSEIINTSTLPLIWSESNSNFFRIEFLFRWPKINLLRLSLRKEFKVLLQSPTLLMLRTTLVSHPSIFILELLSAIRPLKTLQISFRKVWLKMFKPFWFKWNLPLLW